MDREQRTGHALTSMHLPRTLTVLAEGALWRVTHLTSLGQRLVAALGEPDENVRSIAGMMLVKGGYASVPLLYQALTDRTKLPAVLLLLGDVGDASVEKELARFTGDSDEKISRAARDALRVLALRASRAAG